jgi:hypothetical protein
MPKLRAAGQERQAVRIGRTFKVCEHKDRPRIELACASGQSDRKIAAEFGVSRDSVRRHWAGHVSASRKAELVAGPVELAKLAKMAAEQDASLLDYLAILRTNLFWLFEDARKRGLVLDCASIADKLLKVLKVIGELSGQLRQAGITINNVNAVGSVNAVPALVLNDPQIIRMQAAIISALSPFPEARGAVIAALRDLEERLPCAAAGCFWAACN